MDISCSTKDDSMNVSLFNKGGNQQKKRLCDLSISDDGDDIDDIDDIDVSLF